MRKVILTKKLYAEIRRWEKTFGVTNANNIRLLKLYIGMSVDPFITQDGKLLARDFNKLGAILHIRKPRKLIEMAVKSGSFLYGKCNIANMNTYGVIWIASKYLCSDNSDISDGNESCQDGISDAPQNVSSATDKSDSKSGDTLDIYNNMASCHPAGEQDGKENVLQHPHGPFEFCYEGCPQRFFKLDGKTVPIPDNAPDRPAGNVEWYKFLKSWH